ncbi:HAD family phosphatase [Microbulbifer sp. 2205BS26-8]|uniref:HAD family hydrolase n=1 Tax=Microbulbifer sp. 2205BS26-8 TaxID=3064386 RepID=UPI00273E987B|nr:HAD-IB family hydrolase [Microbulbifer sp. 2205BS26-8]MDP5211013.1 HAD-IB family hydrolase [Microbulbifer sp. 2205BS26-8]
MLSQTIAFFDVDETIIQDKSMFSFLFEFYKLNFEDDHLERYTSKIEEVKTLFQKGVKRDVINELYYQSYAGEDYFNLFELGKYWFEKMSRNEGFFIKPVIEALNQHLEKGHKVVLVSGSFRPCLEPIANYLGVDDILCTELETLDGKVTGQLKLRSIGQYKKDRVKKFLSQFEDYDLASYAYGDHISDLDFMEICQNPVAVEGCDSLMKVARKKHWKVIEVH